MHKHDACLLACAGRAAGFAWQQAAVAERQRQVGQAPTQHGGELGQRGAGLQPARDGGVLLLHLLAQHILVQRQQGADHRHVSNGGSGAHQVGCPCQCRLQLRKCCLQLLLGSSPCLAIGRLAAGLAPGGCRLLDAASGAQPGVNGGGSSRGVQPVLGSRSANCSGRHGQCA
jgi:hypothetical protein